MNIEGKKRIILHIILDIVMFFAVVQGWWYIALPLGIIGVWYYVFFVEFIIAGLLYDLLFALNDMGLSGWYGTIVTVFLGLIISIAKRQIRR